MKDHTYIISGLIGFLLTGLSILYGRYKLNHKLVLKKPQYLIWYSLSYGILAGILSYFISTGNLKINDFQPSETPYLVAICVGLTIKSLSKSSLMNFPIGDKKVPIGPKLVFDYLDDFLLKRLNDHIDEQLVVVIKRVSKKLKSGNRTLRVQDELINEVTPTNFTVIERSSYMKEISSLRKPFDKCRYFADKFGICRLEMLEKNLDE
ncbi:PIN domain-containing protein [Draconibacterium sediminis]|uniref:Uncharacterized protein n=1 Tax=Draconibacterium sediminis TaxID=1544798 RepID=A0A0D8JI89_9BACT|nr:hypothetical protein [Draconibacterium sediminis]KJF45568.1 hypothetical protein LH29_09525 [Draconibacterium sediminis]